MKAIIKKLKTKKVMANSLKLVTRKPTKGAKLIKKMEAKLEWYFEELKSFKKK